jgi:hypothetical protein
MPVSVRELRDGRVLVADLQTPAVQLLDARGALAKTIGRKGQGPGEYIEPRAVLAHPGDTTLIVDRQLRRVVVLSPGGDAVRTVALPDPLAREANQAQSDELGTIYTNDAGFGLTPRSDLRPVHRWAFGASRVDSVAGLRTAQMVRSERKGPDGRVMGIMVRAVPYSPEDGWAVAPDGAVAIVRADPYRVEWMLPGGAIVRGPVQQYSAVPVTAKERAADREASLPAAKPPFVASSVLADPFGRVWVGHYITEKATTRRWSIFDRRGARVTTLELPRTVDLLHLGGRGVYVTRRDADDVETLEFHAWR